MPNVLTVLPVLALFGGVAVLGVIALVDRLRADRQNRDRRRSRVRVHLATARAEAHSAPARPHAPALPRVASPHQRWADGELPTQALIAHLTAASAGRPARHRLADEATPEIPAPRTHLALVSTS